MKLLRYTFDNINVRKIIIISVKIINKLLKFTDKINFNFNLKLVRKIISFVQKINIIYMLLILLLFFTAQKNKFIQIPFRLFLSLF